MNATGSTNQHLSSPPAGLLRPAIALALVSLLGFGLAYSLLGTGLGRIAFPTAATGSLIERDGRIVGSTLVAQAFAADRYFQPRPSASQYDAMALAGSNQARTNPDLRKRLEAMRASVATREGVDPAAVPSDLLTQSGGGIDPHISVEGARIQVPRVAKARGLDRGQVEALVAAHTAGPQLGVLGPARVNVLELNLALDAQSEP